MTLPIHTFSFVVSYNPAFQLPQLPPGRLPSAVQDVLNTQLV